MSEIEQAAERVRRCENGDDLRNVYDVQFCADAIPLAYRDQRACYLAFIAQHPTYAALTAKLAEAEAQCEALRVQWKGQRDEREEEYAALRRRNIRFLRIGGTLEAVVPESEDAARLARYDDARPLTPEVVMEMGGSFTRSVSMVCDIYTLGKLTISFYIHPKSTDVTKRDELLLRNATAGNFAKLVDGLGVTP